MNARKALPVLGFLLLVGILLAGCTNTANPPAGGSPNGSIGSTNNGNTETNVGQTAPPAIDESELVLPPEDNTPAADDLSDLGNLGGDDLSPSDLN